MRRALSYWTGLMVFCLPLMCSWRLSKPCRMLAFDHHLLPLHPMLEGDDHRALESKGLITYATKSGYELKVRFLCHNEQVRIVAVTIPRAAADHEDVSKWMKQIMENAISALRLSVDPEASPICLATGFINLMYQSDDPEPNCPARFEAQFNPNYHLSIEHVIAVFSTISTKALAPIAGLLAEAQVPSFPVHYRVLSLVRAIELLYEDKQQQAAALDAFQPHFAALNISDRQFRSALPEIRARCAHGRSSERVEPQPFVGIGYNEPELRSLYELLRSVVAHAIQTMHNLALGGIEHRLTLAES